MTDYRGSTWNLNFGEIGERHQFRIGYIGQPAYEAYFEASQASELSALLGQVGTLQDKDLLTGDTLQVRKIFTGFFNEIAIEPRLDQYPVQIMRLQEVDVDDLIYVINLFRDDVATSPDDWDLTKMGLVDPETGTIKSKYFPDTPKGDKGNPGERGPKGDKGDKGDKGADAVVDDSDIAAILASPESATSGQLASMLDARDSAINSRIDTEILPTVKGTIIPVEAFGAKGDGVTDDTPAINAAIASGKRIKFADGKTYRLGSTVTGPRIDVDAYGATLLIDHGGNGIQQAGVMSDPIVVNSWSANTEMTSVSGGPINVVTIQMAQATPSTWVRGDVIVMASDDILPYSKDAQTGNAAQNLCGQFLRVLSSSGATLKAVGRINDPQMLTNMRVAKMESVGIFKWRGGTIDYAPGRYETGNGYTFWLARQVGPIIRDATVRRTKSGGVYMRTCHSWLIDGVNIGGGANDLSRSAFGYGVANYNGAFGVLSNSYFTDLRHSYTNGGTFIAAGGMSCDGFGRPHDNLIVNCISESCSATAYDSHTQGTRETFQGCKAYNCSGFGLRGTYHMVKDCDVVDGATGVTIFIESTGDRSYGHTIDGLNCSGVTNIGVLTVNRRAGGVAEHQKELTANVFRNIHSRDHRGRFFIGDNTTLIGENILIETATTFVQFGCLFSNSDVSISGLRITNNAPGVQNTVMNVAVNSNPAPKSNIEFSDVKIRGVGTYEYFIGGTTIGTGFRGVDVFMKNLPTIAPKASAYSFGGTAIPVSFD